MLYFHNLSSSFNIHLFYTFSFFGSYRRKSLIRNRLLLGVTTDMQIKYISRDASGWKSWMVLWLLEMYRISFVWVYVYRLYLTILKKLYMYIRYVFSKVYMYTYTYFHFILHTNILRDVDAIFGKKLFSVFHTIERAYKTIGFNIETLNYWLETFWIMWFLLLKLTLTLLCSFVNLTHIVDLKKNALNWIECWMSWSFQN